MWTADDIRPYEPPAEPDRTFFFNPVTITFGELYEGGVIDWNDAERWSWHYYDLDQKKRLEDMMTRRFWLREISIIPPEAWRLAFLQKLDEAMSTARLMYQVLEKHGQDVLVESDEWYKGREIWSDFPQTLLNGSSGDYASNGRDAENESVRTGSFIDAMERLRFYQDPDVYVLDQLESCFSKLVSVNINGY